MKGFTLIELMVTIFVLAILVGVAIPSFTTQIANNRSLALGEEVISALHTARSEAVKRGGNVSLCASSNGTTCAGASDWASGIIIFVDTASETSNNPTVGEVLQVFGGFHASADIVAQRDSAAVSFIRYTGLGTLARLSNPVTTISAKVTGCTGSSARSITVSLSGMVSSERQACSS